MVGYHNGQRFSQFQHKLQEVVILRPINTTADDKTLQSVPEHVVMRHNLLQLHI